MTPTERSLVLIVELLERIAVSLERSRPVEPECPKCGCALQTGERPYKRGLKPQYAYESFVPPVDDPPQAEVLGNPPRNPEPWPFPQQDPEGTSLSG